MEKKTFEQAIRDNTNGFDVIGSEYIVRCMNAGESGLHIYIRPSNKDGETIDFIVKGNSLVRISGIVGDEEYLRAIQ